LPSKEDHIAKAEGNSTLALSMTLESQPKIDWALVILFYAEMHYVEAYLATVGQHLRSPTARDNFVGRDARVRKIFSEYQDLKYYSYNSSVKNVRDGLENPHSSNRPGGGSGGGANREVSRT
jgi:hypothetical protein